VRWVNRYSRLPNSRVQQAAMSAKPFRRPNHTSFSRRPRFAKQPNQYAFRGIRLRERGKRPERLSAGLFLASRRPRHGNGAGIGVLPGFMLRDLVVCYARSRTRRLRHSDRRIGPSDAMPTMWRVVSTADRDVGGRGHCRHMSELSPKLQGASVPESRLENSECKTPAVELATSEASVRIDG
jgi:hypothetical protein